MELIPKRPITRYKMELIQIFIIVGYHDVVTLHVNRNTARARNLYGSPFNATILC